MIARITSWTRRNLPTQEQVRNNRFIPNAVLRSDLWRFTRRSVPRGVALGMLVGIVVPFAQTIFAALLCFPLRANVPVAALTTLVTNPLTTPLIWAFSYNVGSKLLHVETMLAGGPIDQLFEIADFWSFLQWLTSQGKVLAFGLLVVAVLASVASYLLTGLGWNAWIRHKRSLRKAASKASGDSAA